MPSRLCRSRRRFREEAEAEEEAESEAEAEEEAVSALIPSLHVSLWKEDFSECMPADHETRRIPQDPPEGRHVSHETYECAKETY